MPTAVGDKNTEWEKVVLRIDVVLSDEIIQSSVTNIQALSKIFTFRFQNFFILMIMNYARGKFIENVDFFVFRFIAIAKLKISINAIASRVKKTF